MVSPPIARSRFSFPELSSFDPRSLPSMGQQHVVFVNVGAAGHMNPTLPVVAELSRSNAFVGRSERP